MPILIAKPVVPDGGGFGELEKLGKRCACASVSASRLHARIAGRERSWSRLLACPERFALGSRSTRANMTIRAIAGIVQAHRALVRAPARPALDAAYLRRKYHVEQKVRFVQIAAGSRGWRNSARESRRRAGACTARVRVRPRAESWMRPRYACGLPVCFT